MAQEKQSHHQETDRQAAVEHVGEAAVDAAERKKELDEDIDAILDEIDDVLATNAEQFVKEYVQKGGQ